MNNQPTRTLLPYEKNHLRKYGVSQETALATESPVEYLTHHVDFCGLDFYVNENVLIPRIETEELVDMAVKTTKEIYKKVARKLSIIDIGTGSGAIAICLAQRLENDKIPFQIIATEVSPRALEIAKKNAKRLVPTANILFEERSLLDGQTEKFDLIISNLPYIPTPRIEFLEESVKDFEPRVALDGGENGLTLIHQMINQAKNLVYPHSKILLEVDYTHGYDEFNTVRTDWNIVVTPDSMVGVHFVELSPVKQMKSF